MSKYITPILAVVVGLLASYGLQEVDIESLWAKVVGVVVSLVAFFVIGYIRALRA